MLKRDGKIGEYILIEKCGSGGFGEVWRAEKRTRLSVNEFALKFFRPKDTDSIDIERVKKEIETWKRVSGLPNIISIFEADIYEDYVYIVSEFADGGSLEKWLKENGGKAKSLEQAIEITQGILKGLESLHGRGFVHRDLKPANVLFRKGVACLADFGISREMQTYSKATSTAGTYEFMPPEAFQKNPSVSVHTDIWSVGVILQKLLTGELPFPQDEIPSLITAILYAEPESLPENVPPEIKIVVARCLQKDREKRFQSTKEIYAELEKALLGLKTNSLEVQPTLPDLNFVQTKQIETVGATFQAITSTRDDAYTVETEIKTFLPGHFSEDENLKLPSSANPKFLENQLLEFAEKPNDFFYKIILFVSASIVLIAGITALFIFPNQSNTGNLNGNAENFVANKNQSTDAPIGRPYNSRVNAPASNTREYFQIGEDCYLQRDYDCAIENYTKAIKLNPKSANAYNNRGLSYLNKNDYFKATADFNKAIEINPNNILFYQNRLLAYEKTNDVAQAELDRKIIQRLQKSK
jgi:serine/threonine protein kinase